MEYREIILRQLKREIPEFEYNGMDKEDVFIVFSFFSAFIVNNLNNEGLLNRVVRLIDEICVIDNVNVKPLLDEIAITLYDCGYYDIIRRKLSGRAIGYFDEAIDKWKKGNGL